MAYRVGIIGCGRMGGTIDDEVTGSSHADFVLPYGHVNGYAAVPETQVVAEVPFPTWKGHSGTVAIIRDLIRSIETGRSGRSNLEVARRGMEILFGMAASQRQGGVRVKLPLDNRKISVHSA